MSKYLREYVIEESAGGQRDQVYKIRRVLIAQLQKCRSHAVKLGHRRAPLGVHPDDWPSDELA